MRMTLNNKKKFRTIFTNSLVITILVFAVGLLLSYGLDFLRIDEVVNTMNTHELDTESYLVEKEFVSTFGGDDCRLMTDRIGEIKLEMTEVGQDLSNYGGKTIFKKGEFDLLKRKYFLLQLNFLGIIEELNDKCGLNYVPILFFFELDNSKSERQGFILDDYAQAHRSDVIVVALDKDYEDEPLINLLKEKYNVTSAPTIIINNKVKFEKLTYTGEINATVWSYLRPGIDEFGQGRNFGYTIHASGFDTEEYVAQLNTTYPQFQDEFSKGDALLTIGRLTSSNDTICSSLKHYFAALNQSAQLDALVYETAASIDCGANVRAMYLEAAKIWDELNVSWRAEIDRRLAYGSTINFDYEVSPLEQSQGQIIRNVSTVQIGDYGFTINSSTIIVSQADRVVRDWLSYQIGNNPYVSESRDYPAQPPINDLIRVMSEKLTYNETELQEDIGWHEGGRIYDIRQAAGAKHHIAGSTLVALINGTWYAPNENGVFMFEVPYDKLWYPTTRFLREDLAIITDTHGINMLVEQALRFNADVVIGCCDHPAKIKAVKYLSDHGIKTICFTDKYLPLLMLENVSAVGSPPIRKSSEGVIIGNSPVNISAAEPLVVMNMTGAIFATSYYQTPTIYFNALENFVDLNATYLELNNFYQMDDLIFAAELRDAQVVAARVYNSDDYEQLKRWLAKNNSRRAILFHSASYPYGQKIFKEFPEQTTFDDVNPKFY